LPINLLAVLQCSASKILVFYPEIKKASPILVRTIVGQTLIKKIFYRKVSFISCVFQVIICKSSFVKLYLHIFYRTFGLRTSKSYLPWLIYL